MSFFTDLLAAAHHGAASVYHAILATGAEIHTWESNPVVASLISVGVGVANDVLARVGIPASTLQVIEADVHGALKAIAAADPTVPSTGSIGAVVNLAGSIAGAVYPAALPMIATIGLVESGVEALITPAPGPDPAP